MPESERSFILVLLAALIAAPAASGVSQEPKNSQPAPAADATRNPPKYKKPQRGPAPTLDQFQRVEYDSNPDGTIKRRVVVPGQSDGADRSAVEGGGAVPSSPRDTDRRAAPSRATVGSIDDTARSPEGPATTDTARDRSAPAPAPWSPWPWLMGAAVITLVGLGAVLGYRRGRSRRSGAST